uniref:lysosome-associated membrane glycoprotein 1 isoform X2 n=1 Tax=Ciona intestinalis TaxID=7719 RepID=UPI0005217FB6|nr:lysosome-associated membrane glycoprotein 1 isoform X2 [Ciona intestinalis]|eukprot:XP_009861583.1 lysosome-associated membrane glycoprotein 1 isoform X2 [Ciona intestinalis]
MFNHILFTGTSVICGNASENKTTTASASTVAGSSTSLSSATTPLLSTISFVTLSTTPETITTDTTEPTPQATTESNETTTVTVPVTSATVTNVTTGQTSTVGNSSTAVSTTTAPPSTTAASPTTGTPLTTAAPSPFPSQNEYTVSENGVICLKVDIKAYFKKGEAVLENVTSLYKVDNSSSSCSLIDVVYMENEFSMTFKMDTKNSSFYLSYVKANLNGIEANSTQLTVGKVALKASYMCASGIEVKMSNNITMVLEYVQFQAFKIDNGKYGIATKCHSDLSSIIPIVVGSVLAGLILVVILAYVVGRRRSRTGYEEI